jgi:hypothetical protein
MLEYALLVAFVIIILMHKDLQKLYHDYQLISSRLTAMEQSNSTKSTHATQTDPISQPSLSTIQLNKASYNTFHEPCANSELHFAAENGQPHLRCESQQEFINKEENKEEIKDATEGGLDARNSKNPDNEAEANYSKTYYNLMSLSKEAKLETPVTKGGNGEMKAEDSNDSIDKLTKMKKIGLQDMTINKISKMIQNHSQIKEDNMQKPFSNPMLSYKKINERKSSLDRRGNEPKSINLNIGYFRPSLNSSTTSKHKEMGAFDTSRTTKEDEEKHKKEKELIIMRRTKAKQFSEQGRKLLSYKKEISK